MLAQVPACKREDTRTRWKELLVLSFSHSWASSSPPKQLVALLQEEMPFLCSPCLFSSSTGASSPFCTPWKSAKSPVVKGGFSVPSHIIMRFAQLFIYWNLLIWHGHKNFLGRRQVLLSPSSFLPSTPSKPTVLSKPEHIEGLLNAHRAGWVVKGVLSRWRCVELQRFLYSHL